MITKIGYIPQKQNYNKPNQRKEVSFGTNIDQLQSLLSNKPLESLIAKNSAEIKKSLLALKNDGKDRILELLFETRGFRTGQEDRYFIMDLYKTIKGKQEKIRLVEESYGHKPYGGTYRQNLETVVKSFVGGINPKTVDEAEKKLISRISEQNEAAKTKKLAKKAAAKTEKLAQEAVDGEIKSLSEIFKK